MMVLDKKVMVATPMYGGMCYHGYVDGLVRNFNDLNRHSYFYEWNFLANESLITRARNWVTHEFLQSDCTHLFFIDSDICFPHDAIRRVLDADEDIVCAPYPKKIIDWEKIKLYAFNADPHDISRSGSSFVINYLNSKDIPNPNEKGLIEIRHGGTGFMCIKREVFEKMELQCKKARASNFGRFNVWYTEYFYTGVGDDGVFQSEDWMFCENWKKMNGKIWLMKDIQLDHIGTYVYSGDILKFGANIT